MTTEVTYKSRKLDTLGEERADLDARLKENRAKLHAEILAAYDGGLGTVEIARRARLTRDAVRQLLRKTGRIGPDAPAER